VSPRPRTNPPPPGRPGRRAPSARGAWRWTVLLASAAAVAAVGLLVIRQWRHPDPGAPDHPGTMAPMPPDSLSRMQPEAAYARAVQLVDAGEAQRSLPFFQRALSFSGEPATAHIDYSVGLNNTAVQFRAHLGIPENRTRSSYERVALLREALAQLDIAESLATIPALRAEVHANRAQRYLTWGFQLEAWREFREAEADAPGAWRATADEWSRRLQHPERPDPGPPAPPARASRR